ncbi:MAG TPA: GAF domain-containing protein [Candidatus Dormibacteraeota bacterium]|nr:GAF domain-containing protein [Candidatus Dormibacteraeota bacterium]
MDSACENPALVRLDTELAEANPNVESILVIATSSLSRIRPGTWVASMMNPDPETSRVVVGNDNDHALAEYVERYIAAIDRPKRAPTTGMSANVIETGDPVVVPSIPFAELVNLLSPAGQDFVRANPPPGQVRNVGALVVPMRVGGATIGTLGIIDWYDRSRVTSEDVAWVQPVADRVALSLEHARLVGTTRAYAGQMELIKAMAMATAHGQDLRVTLREMVEQIAARLQVDAADILLRTDSGGELAFAAGSGFRLQPQPDLRVALDEQAVARYGPSPRVEPLRATATGVRRPRGAAFAREGFAVMLTVPLHTRGRLIGVLELFHRSRFDWEQDWLNFFETLGGLIAAAIDQPVTAGGQRRSDSPRAEPNPGLTDLEFAILQFIVEGLTNREIADQLHRSENTVKFHVRRILEKTDAANRTELARRATRAGWL